MSSHNTESDAAHSLADLSIIHRDLLWLLSQAGLSEGRSLHHTLSDYYPDSIDQTRVCNALQELIERDYISKKTRNTTTYQLTEPARRALTARQAWQGSSRDANERGHK